MATINQKIHGQYLNRLSAHEGADWVEIWSMEVMPPGGLGAGTMVTSPLLTRSRRVGAPGRAMPRCQGRRAALRNAPLNIRSGTRLLRTMALTVVGLPRMRACSGDVRLITVSDCAVRKC